MAAYSQNASLFYCTLYSPGGSTDAVARQVSFARITFLCYRLAIFGYFEIVLC